MSVSEEASQHYVYTHAYPEDMGGYVFYIGKGVGDRIYKHEQEAKKGKKSHKCSVIRKIWRAGGQVVKTKVAFFTTHEEALLYEQALIILMKPYGHLTNLTDGGEGVWGHRPSERVRYKLSEAHKTSLLAQEQRCKLAENRRGKTVEPFSEGHRRKIGENTKKQWASVEYRRKISEGRERWIAQQRAQALAKMRYPVISSTDASWKQGVVQTALWEESA